MCFYSLRARFFSRVPSQVKRKMKTDFFFFFLCFWFSIILTPRDPVLPHPVSVCSRIRIIFLDVVVAPSLCRNHINVYIEHASCLLHYIMKVVGGIVAASASHVIGKSGARRAVQYWRHNLLKFFYILDFPVWCVIIHIHTIIPYYPKPGYIYGENSNGKVGSPYP